MMKVKFNNNELKDFFEGLDRDLLKKIYDDAVSVQAVDKDKSQDLVLKKQS